MKRKALSGKKLPAHKIHKCASQKELATLIADKIISSVKEHEKKAAQCNMMIPGGRSIQETLRQVIKKQNSCDWKHVHLYFVDERITNKEKDTNQHSNKEFLAQTKIPKENIHLFQHNTKTPEEDCDKYNKLIAKNKIIDIVLLGAGEDGHIASLFPEHKHTDSNKDIILIDNSPKKPAERITITPQVLDKTKLCLLVFNGKEKQAAFELWSQTKSEKKCPAKYALKATECHTYTHF